MGFILLTILLVLTILLIVTLGPLLPNGYYFQKTPNPKP